jgi:hypothetical protein
MKPSARRSGLVVRELPDEVVVYDTVAHRAHCLNRTAGVVFRHADGTRSIEELGRLLDPEGPAAQRETAARMALEALDEAALLDTAIEAAHTRLSRRAAMRRAGVGAVLLPVVASLLVPTPAEAAATCVNCCIGVPNGTPCTSIPGGTCGTATCISDACSDGGTCP